MNKLHIEQTELTPEIVLDPGNKEFHIKGNSRPEDVRELYYPVIEWLAEYRHFLQNDGNSVYTEDDPLIVQFYLAYFNSSTAKFLYDIIHEIRNIKEDGVPVEVTWHYDEDDFDMYEAGKTYEASINIPTTLVPIIGA